MSDSPDASTSAGFLIAGETRVGSALDLPARHVHADFVAMQIARAGRSCFSTLLSPPTS